MNESVDKGLWFVLGMFFVIGGMFCVGVVEDLRERLITWWRLRKINRLGSRSDKRKQFSCKRLHMDYHPWQYGSVIIGGWLYGIYFCPLCREIAVTAYDPKDSGALRGIGHLPPDTQRIIVGHVGRTIEHLNDKTKPVWSVGTESELEEG